MAAESDPLEKLIFDNQSILNERENLSEEAPAKSDLEVKPNGANDDSVFNHSSKDDKNSFDNVIQAVGEFDSDNEDSGNEGDDTVNVILKSTNKSTTYKTGVTYQARSQTLNVQGQKQSRQGINLNDPGNIQGVSTMDYNLHALGDDEKPWKRPGSDLTDYFNYGFTEETWMQYCEKQKLLRQEYANSTLKPVIMGTAAGLGLTGLSLTQRNRFVGIPTRSGENKPANINIINLSSNSRLSAGDSEPLSTNAVIDDDVNPESPIDMASNASNLYSGTSLVAATPGTSFTLPPPGYPALSGMSDPSAAVLQLNNVAAAGVNAFNVPPPGFSNTAVGLASAAGIFQQLSSTPGIAHGLLTQNHNSSQNWTNTGPSGLISLLPSSRGHASGILPRHGQSPDDLFSEEDIPSDYRHRRRMEDELGDRYEREQYRSSRRSRSRSKPRHYTSRSRRRQDECSDKDYNRYGERSHKRSRDHHSRHPHGSTGDYGHERGSSRSRERNRDRSAGRSSHRSSREHRSRRSDRESRNEKSSNGGTNFSRAHRYSRGEREGSRRECTLRSVSPSHSVGGPQLALSPCEKKGVSDPLAAAAAAAADINARLQME